MNGLAEAPGEKLLRGLTQLEPGEKWLIKPKKLNEEGTLWSPGIRDNVRPGSWFHVNECFGPVLGIMHAETLEEAIEWQNSTGYGLTGGIHTLDNDEIDYWLERVEVGNAYVNRGITGAIVQRQSFGGWKQSVMGPGAKAGGPNYVAQFGTWSDGPLRPFDVDITQPVVSQLRAFANLSLSDEDTAWLWRAAELDELAWQQEFGRDHDRAGLVCEANVFRYRPLLSPLQVRISEDAQLRDVARLTLAATRTNSPVRFSATPEKAAELRELGFNVEALSASAFLREVSSLESGRVRSVGSVEEGVFEAAVKSNSVVLDQPVLADGRRELLPFLLEQAVSVTMHRFGIIRTVGSIRG